MISDLKDNTTRISGTENTKSRSESPRIRRSTAQPRSTDRYISRNSAAQRNARNLSFNTSSHTEANSSSMISVDFTDEEGQDGHEESHEDGHEDTLISKVGFRATSRRGSNNTASPEEPPPNELKVRI